jgi:hypothetical protein
MLLGRGLIYKVSYDFKLEKTAPLPPNEWELPLSKAAFSQIQQNNTSIATSQKYSTTNRKKKCKGIIFGQFEVVFF